MKRALIATLVFCVGTLSVMGQQSTSTNTSRSNVKNNSPVFSQGPGGKARCTVSGAACTKAQLEQFNTTLTTTNAAADQAKKDTSGHTYNTTKSNVKTNAVRLGTDGSLLCETNDGKTQPCTAAHVADLNNAAAAMTIPKPVGPRDPASVK
jgi:Tfp pilus assembly protein PilV